MRMTYMYYLLRKNYEALENLSFKKVEERLGSTISNYGAVDNWLAAKDALINIKDIPFNERVLDTLYMMIDHNFGRGENSFQISYKIYNQLKDEYPDFLTQIKGIINFCELAGLSLDKSGFDVKMPPTRDFNEFADNVHSLQVILQQCPYLNVNGETIELNSVDVGSIWMKFVVVATSTTIVLSNLATIIDKCEKIKSHMIICKQQEEQLRTMELQNEVLESVIENNKIITNAMIERAVKELQNELSPNLSLEEQKKLSFSIEQLLKLMGKGMEIYASVDAPDEVKDLFPTLDEVKSLCEPIKMLEE